MATHPEPARPDRRRKRLPSEPGRSARSISDSTCATTASASTVSTGDRILHEALTAGPDPLHLALVFNLSITTASRYAAIASTLLDGEFEQHAAEQ
jgi:hypothetical protein